MKGYDKKNLERLSESQEYKYVEITGFWSKTC